MKKNNKGFFLAETIVVLALVTTVVVFVSANVPNLYKNYKLQIESYDRTEDIYLLKAIEKANEDKIKDATKGDCSGVRVIGAKPYNDGALPTSEGYSNGTGYYFDNNNLNLPTGYSSSKFYLTSYLVTPSVSGDYDFNKYLKRVRKTSNFQTDYRLIGKLVNGGKTTYASIRIDNPNPDRGCNLGG